MAVRVKTYRVGQRGIRGHAISLPSIWIDDLGLKPGDALDFYRDEEGRLIIVPPGVPPMGDRSQQARELREAMDAAGA